MQVYTDAMLANPCSDVDMLPRRAKMDVNAALGIWNQALPHPALDAFATG